MGITEKDPLAQLSLPPGFRFFPTDEELLVQYLCRKVAGQQFSLQIIGDIDLYKFDPWDLPNKALFGEKEWYFFSPRDRKYPNGSRPNRVAGSGYWKATGTDKVIFTEGRRVGIKKALVFYVGKAPKGSKTNWIMHEFRLMEHNRKDGSSKLDDWVLCRIYKKNSSAQKQLSDLATSSREYSNSNSNNGSSSSSSSHLEDVLESLPDIDNSFFDLPRANSLKTQQKEDKFMNDLISTSNFDWASLTGLNSVPGGQNPTHGITDYGYNDIFVPSTTSATHKIDEEVQSGFKTPRFDSNTGFLQQNSDFVTRNFSNADDPFGLSYPTTQTGGFGFRL